jgi:aryl-alcohol dehydrogenase-like predicted oxidoreductase
LNQINLGLGTASWHRLENRKQVDRLLALSRDLGYSFIDTSPYYSGGRNQWLLRNSKLKSDFDIIVKVGIPYTPYLRFERIFHPTSWDSNETQYLNPKSIRSDVTRSFKRLGLSEVSTILLHSPPIEQNRGKFDEYVTVMQEMKKSGLCQSIGFSSDTISTQILEWCSVIESPIDLVPHKHRQPSIEHVFFGISRDLRNSLKLLENWTCRDICKFSFLAGSTEPKQLERIQKFAINPLN